MPELVHHRPRVRAERREHARVGVPELVRGQPRQRHHPGVREVLVRPLDRRAPHPVADVARVHRSAPRGREHPAVRVRPDSRLVRRELVLQHRQQVDPAHACVGLGRADGDPPGRKVEVTPAQLD